MAEIIVFILTGLADLSNAGILQRAFSHSRFDVREMVATKPREIHFIRKALKLAAKEKDKPVIVISYRMTTHMTANDVECVIRKAVKLGGFDLMYLNHFMDMCQLMTPVDPQNISDGPHLMKTLAPQGHEAILYMPSGRDMILGKRVMHNAHYIVPNDNLSQQLRDEIYASNIVAICTSPNMFTFDIINNAQRNEDYLKCNECLPVKLIDGEIEDNKAGFTIPGFLFFLFITVIILIVAWAVWQLYPGPKIAEPEKDEKKPALAQYGTGNNPEIANHNGGDHTEWKSM